MRSSRPSTLPWRAGRRRLTANTQPLDGQGTGELDGVSAPEHVLAGQAARVALQSLVRVLTMAMVLCEAVPGTAS